MLRCHKFYPNCQWTVTQFWPDRALDTVLLTKVYWSYSTSIVRVCFTPLLPPTLRKDLKRNRNFQIKVNSLAMASLYELLCYYSLEYFDPHRDESLTFIHSTLSSRYSCSAISTAPPSTTDGKFNEFYNLQYILHTNFGMCNPKTTEYFPRRGLVQALDD